MLKKTIDDDKPGGQISTGGRWSIGKSGEFAGLSWRAFIGWAILIGLTGAAVWYFAF